MIESISVQGVGPVAALEMKLAPRLNLITGDNGLGKSFLLDIAWWVLTESWLNGKVLPKPGKVPDARIEGRFKSQLAGTADASNPTAVRTYRFGAAGLEWLSSGRRIDARNTRIGDQITADPLLGRHLALCARIDGGFSIWDPCRNFHSSGSHTWDDDDIETPHAIHFGVDELWNGLSQGDAVICNGMIRDWLDWQQGKAEVDGRLFRILQSTLKILSPPDEPMRVGEPGRRLGDARRLPMLELPFETIPVTHASAAMKRILSLAYVLVWAWHEHVTLCEQLGIPQSNEMLLLIDEIENHLHPRWQRTILKALLDIVTTLTERDDVKIQLFIVTHSPLILASAEPHFDDTQDAWFDLDLVRGERPHVVLSRRDFVRHGDVSNWLTSEAFDLEQSRSLEAERAIQKALEIVRKSDASEAELEAVTRALQATLGDTDRFWMRWSQFRASRSSRLGGGV